MDSTNKQWAKKVKSRITVWCRINSLFCTDQPVDYKKCHCGFKEALGCRSSLGDNEGYFLLNNMIWTSWAEHFCDRFSRGRRDGGFFRGAASRKLWLEDAPVTTETKTSVASWSEHPPCFILGAGTSCSGPGMMSGLRKTRDFHDGSFIKFIYFYFCASNLFV